jgi:hypothetical protein
MNQQLRNTELTGKTAEINHTPLGKELVRYKEHGAKNKQAQQIMRVANNLQEKSYLIPFKVAKTSARFGAPTALPTSTPTLFKTKVDGVERTSSRRTKSKFFSASISTCTTSSRSAVISVSNARVARHGVQNAEENCTRVTREPKS